MIELRLRSRATGPGQAELLRCMLITAGIALERIVEKRQRGVLSFSVFTDSVREARAIAGAVRELRLKGISFSFVPLKDSDWKTRWKKYFKPFNITREIRIIPVWEQAQSAPAGMAGIRLDTTSAFGTGLHATTRMVAGMIRSRRGRLGAFLDIGTGSGILSVIAFRYGAKLIRAIDFDKESVVTARKNFRRNGCPDRFLAAQDFARFTSGRRFDFVAANLFTEDLVRFCPKLISLVEPGGYLAVSGIFADNYPSFRARFKDRRARCVEVAKRGKWYAALYRIKGGAR